MPRRIFGAKERDSKGIALAAKGKGFEAWVRHGANDVPISCTVKTIAARGATISAPEVALPNRFTLLLLSDGSVSRNCEIVSRKGFSAVVRFI